MSKRKPMTQPPGKIDQSSERKSHPRSLPAELAARAVFLAKLHREKNVQSWLARIIKERVEIEERAFSQAKRALSAQAGR